MSAGDVAALLAATGLGGVLGGLFTAEHQRVQWFREQMIQAAEAFLSASEKTRAALQMLSLHSALTKDGRPLDPNELGALRLDFETSLEAARAVIPRLGVVFPPIRHGSGVHEHALDVVRNLREIEGLIQKRLEGQDVDTTPAFEALGRAVGLFAGLVNALVWKRWHFRRAINLRRLRAARGAQESHRS